MVLNKAVVRASQWGFSPFLSRYESHGTPRKVRGDLCVCSQGNPRGVLRLRGCLDRHEGALRRAGDGFGKAHAVAPPPYRSRSARGSELGLEDEVRAAKLANGRATPLRLLNHSPTDKLVVAVDVDEGTPQYPFWSALLLIGLISQNALSRRHPLGKEPSKSDPFGAAI